MGLLYVECPRLAVSFDLPDELAADFRQDFSYAVTSRRPIDVGLEYRIQLDEDGARLFRNRTPIGIFPDRLELMFSIEEDIENAVLERLGGWVGLHAGAAVCRGGAIVVVGRPDTGKTTTTFQLVELGLDLLCEEITPIDPTTRMVQPFPQVLTLARHYAEEFRSRYPVTGGTLSFPAPAVARYAAARVARQPVPLSVIVFPAFDPSCQPTLEEVDPGQMLTDLLQHCFPPALGDEQLYDAVIRLITQCRLFRLRTCGIASARERLLELIAKLP